MSTTFDQTRSPWLVRLLNRGGGWWQNVVPPSPIRASDLTEIAKQRCNLDDFGPGDFFEPLSRLLESCYGEAQLNVIGKIALRSDLVRMLCNRLLMQRDRQKDPQIEREQIREPLFIVGLPRSGTTLLHTLLAADPSHRAPLTWEVLSPSPPNGEGTQRRIARARRSLSWLAWLAPTFRQVHALGAELPQECVGLMSPSMLSDQFDSMYRVPSYRSWLFKQDLTPAYRYHRHFLQHLQRRLRLQRWILKAPVHMFALPALLAIYPDALFVQAHRHPLEAVVSVSSLVSILRNIFSDAVDPSEVGRDALQYWAATIATFMQHRDHIAAARICDVDYVEIQRDPIGAVRRIYAHFGWHLSAEAKERMSSVLANQPREQNGLHHYEPLRFGLEPNTVAQHFAAYCERFGFSEKRRTSYLKSAEISAISLAK